ncbi:polysaccharide lyase family 8 super-sandwich domain-containing protein [Pseudopedobacter beijingensis]|uniref:Polysaccharide lyase family 8 super-sandwich domain-containing protein n=1 Tax=Pseudopedobacter beijingensis TaxID=1207056 RepID=A0ABW4IG18_9SPHI
MKRIDKDLQEGVDDKQLASKVKRELPRIKPDGSWSDIDYSNAMANPLRRMVDMAMAYTRTSNDLYKDQDVYGALIRSLENWYIKNPVNPNWWYNDIYYPQALGKIMIIMRESNKPLSAELEAKLISRMMRKLKAGDGANTSDQALHYLFRACLTEKREVLDSAATYLYEPIAINNDKTGLQLDGSYFQHGKQQAIASYGRVFVGNSIDAAYYLHGTEYALPAEKLKILVDFLNTTFLKTIRGNVYDFNVRGRGISRKDSLYGQISPLIQKLKIIDPKNNPTWDSAIRRITEKKPGSYNISPGNQYYWKAGYALHTRPAYTFSVQSASNRTLRTERGNNENVLGKFLSDGATNIQVSGKEYLNIMPVWEWDKIPGVTSHDYPDDSGSLIKQEWRVPGSTDFVGGVSNGIYGLATMEVKHDSLSAKKAWFLFDNEVVCLGAGITSALGLPVTTTINQCWLSGGVETENNQSVKNNADSFTTDTKWVLHDGIAYLFPQQTNITVSTATQSGSWHRINQLNGDKKQLEGQVFKAFINHGTNPSNTSYSYIIRPGIKNKNELKTINMDEIQLLANSPEVQATWHKSLDILQAVFYQKTSLEHNLISIETDQPCTLMFTGLNTNPTLYISAPLHQATEINITLKYKGNTKSIVCKMPANDYKGATVTIPVK